MSGSRNPPEMHIAGTCVRSIHRRRGRRYRVAMREKQGVRVRNPALQPGMGGDLRGVARPAVEAVAGQADLVETVHANIARLPGSRTPPPVRTRGITALAYTAARGVTRVVGDTVDTALTLLEPWLSERSTRPGYEALLAALNGVMGDWLGERPNPRAIKMCLRSPRPQSTTRWIASARRPAAARRAAQGPE